MTKHLNDLNCREETHALVDRLFSELKQENYEGYLGKITIIWETTLCTPRSNHEGSHTI